MRSKGSGTYVRWLGDGHQPNEKTGTQLFPAPPRTPDHGAPPPDALSATPDTSMAAQPGSESRATPGPSSSSSPAVGEATPNGAPREATRSPAVMSPRPARNAAPLREVNLATQIFVVSPSPPAARDAKPSGRASQIAQTRVAPAFSPVPNAPISNPKPSSEANQPAQTFTAPLLRAFEDTRPRAATWSTAKTVTASVAQIEQGERAAKAPVGPVARAEPKSPRLTWPQQLLRALRQSSAATKRISALVVATALLVGSGTLVARSIAERTLPGSTSSAPAVPVATGAHVAPPVAVEAPTEPPNSALTNWSPPPAEATAPEPSTTRAPASKVAHGKPTRAADSAPHRVTLARQAVDALLAGDRPQALLRYTELSRLEPERAVYREAARLLAPSAADLQGSP